jgi:predicted P-loop ATPase
MRKIDIPLILAERDQLWAEALARINAGEQWWFSDQEEEIFKQEVRDYIDVDSIQEAIERGIRLTKPSMRKEVYTILEIFDLLGMDPTKVGQSERTRVGMSLIRLGFLRMTKDVDGRAQRVYKMPAVLLKAINESTKVPQAYSGPAPRAQA